MTLEVIIKVVGVCLALPFQQPPEEKRISEDTPIAIHIELSAGCNDVRRRARWRRVSLLFSRKPLDISRSRCPLR
jgi:hypothetical protein